MYCEDLKRGINAEVGPKDYFEIASIIPPGNIFAFLELEPD